MKNKLFLMVTLAIMILTSCNSKSLDDKFNSKTYKEDITTLSKKKLLTDSESVLLTKYIDSKTGDSSSLANSYSKLLETAKAEDKIKKEKDAKRKQLNEQIQVKVNKKFIASNVYRNGAYNNEIVLVMNIRNFTDKKINGMQFKLTYKNKENETLLENFWNIDKSIDPKSEIDISVSAGVYDNSNENLVKFNVADLTKLIFEYQINKLMFDDGTSINVE